jgi:hypothetical protein
MGGEIMNLTRYYKKREPVLVFRLDGFDRQFVAYTQEAVDILTARARTEPLDGLYRDLCERALRGEPDIAALPKDAPSWTRDHGRWRPCEQASANGGAP